MPKRMVVCPKCEGTGSVSIPYDQQDPGAGCVDDDCPKCGGTGVIQEWQRYV